MITGAPVILLAITATEIVAIWYWMRHRFAHQISSKDSIIRIKDERIEAWKESYGQLDDRFKEALRSREQEVQQLGRTASESPDKLLTLVESLRSQLEERRAREWAPLTSDLKRELTAQIRTLPASLKQRDFRHIDIRRAEFTDCIDLADDLADCFRRAGWEVPFPPRAPETGASISTGIWVAGPLHDPRTEAMANVLFEALDVEYRPIKIWSIESASSAVSNAVRSSLPAILADLMTIQIVIGRKPRM